MYFSRHNLRSFVCQSSKKKKIKSWIRQTVKEKGGSMKLSELAKAVSKYLGESEDSLDKDAAKDLLRKKISSSSKLTLDKKMVRIL